MRLRMLAVPIVFIIGLNLVGCSTNQSMTSGTNTPYQLTDFAKYKGSYIGDNSAVVNILSMLPAHEYLSSLSLQTVHKPYGITVNYQANPSGQKDYDAFWNGKRPDELVERNAAVLFSLIQNVDVVSFHVQDVGTKMYTFTRTDVQQKYGDLNHILHDQASLTNFLNA